MPASDQGVAHSSSRYHLVPRVLCFVLAGDEVLLLRGAPTRRLWPNKYNGLGGHVERGESPHQAARRELREEAGLEVQDLRLRGVMTIETGEAAGVGLFIFTARPVGRHVTASSEGALEWVHLSRVAELDTVEDLPALLARLLSMPTEAAPFGAHVTYDALGQRHTVFSQA